MSGYYARSRFAPKPRSGPAPAPVKPVRTVADGQDPKSIVCIRICAGGYATGRRIWHTIDTWNERFRIVMLDTDPSQPETGPNLFEAVQAMFPGIDWDYSHQILIDKDGTPTVWSAPDVDEAGFIPEEDGTFGRLKLPRYRSGRDAGLEAAA